MSLLIDGYNLLHATDIFGEGNGAESFRRSREALLQFLATSLNAKERQQTTIVFDAAGAPSGLPDHVVVEEINVRYARDYPDADSLIEELIEEELSPRSLLVVSSDHRVQRAARRRGAKSIDSDRWYIELWRRRVELRRRQEKTVPEKPIGRLSAAEIAYWTQQFDSSDPIEALDFDQASSTKRSASAENPFPPGYGEDLLEEDARDN